MYPESITDFFTPQSLNADGSVTMLVCEPVDRKTLYLTNRYGQKLLKIWAKNETPANSDAHCAQIKLIPYGIKRAWIWQDRPSDPLIVKLRDGVNLTYHGGAKTDKVPKVHLKGTNGYITLIEDSLSLSDNTDHPVPLFSLETGYANQWPLTNPVTKKSHVATSGVGEPVRFDLYLAAATFDLATFMNSMHSHNLLWTQDYLVAAKNCPLTSGPIIAPITFYRMGQYGLIVRRSISGYKGRARLQFYNNKNYYTKLMDRRIAKLGPDGSLTWSTAAQEEERLRAEGVTHSDAK